MPKRRGTVSAKVGGEAYRRMVKVGGARGSATPTREAPRKSSARSPQPKKVVYRPGPATAAENKAQRATYKKNSKAGGKGGTSTPRREAPAKKKSAKKGQQR